MCRTACTEPQCLYKGERVSFTFFFTFNGKLEECILKYLPEVSDFHAQAHAKPLDFLPTADGDQ